MKRKEKLPDELHSRLDRRFDFSVPMQLFELLQLLCEGHFSDMQNYLREQEDNQISINALEPMIAVLELTAKSIDRRTLALALKTLACLTEVMQGPCFENQEFVTSQNIADVATKILDGVYGDCDTEGIWELRMATITMLLAIFEGHMNVQMLQLLVQSLSFQSLANLMDSVWVEWAGPRGLLDEGNFLTAGMGAGKDFLKGLFLGLGSEDEFHDTLNLSCSIFILMKTLLDVQQLSLMAPRTADNFDGFIDRDGRTIKEGFRLAKYYKQLSQKIASIEIARNGAVEKAYFRVPLMSTTNLRKQAKEDLIRDVDRAGDSARLQDFLDRCFNLIYEIEYYEDMQKTPGLALIYKYAWYFDNGSLLLSVAISIFMICTVDSAYINNRNNIKDGPLHDAYDGLAICLIVLQCLVFVNFFFGPIRIRVNECWLAWQDEKNDAAIRESKKTFSIEPPKLEPDAKDNLPFFIRWGYMIYFIATWWPFYQRALFIITAFLGYYISPVFQCIQLLQIVEKSTQLQNVMLSVSKNGVNLLLTAVLLVVVLYIFAIIAYYNYSEFFLPDNFGYGAECDSLWRCTLLLIVYGLSAGGGIGDTLEKPVFNGTSTPYLRLLYDFLFFLMLIVIGLNIVFGIILDTFGELREQRDAVVEDQKTKCFICGQPEADFDRVAPGGFEQHFTFEHHMWDYLFFLHYVKLKDADQHSGPEGFVHECMEERDIQFFPAGKSMTLLAADGVDPTKSSVDADGEGKKLLAVSQSRDESAARTASSAESNLLLERRVEEMEKMLRAIHGHIFSSAPSSPSKK